MMHLVLFVIYQNQIITKHEEEIEKERERERERKHLVYE